MAKEWALFAWEKAQFWKGYEQELGTLVVYGIGIAVYALAVYLMWETIGRRDLVRDESAPRGSVTRRARFFRATGYLALYPLVTFAYFAFLSVSLFFLAKGQTVATILLSSMAIVVGIRTSAYLSSNLSRDVAKLLPLSLLGVFIIEPGYFDWGVAWAKFADAVALWPLLVRYFLLLALVEVALRAIEVAWHAGVRGTKRRRAKRASRDAVRIVPASAPVAEFEPVRAAERPPP